jgi:hypothetical protein
MDASLVTKSNHFLSRLAKQVQDQPFRLRRKSKRVKVNLMGCATTQDTKTDLSIVNSTHQGFPLICAD